jgi:flagellin
MSRINTNVTSLISSRILNNNNVSMGKALERLSTGYRINRGSDDPAGLIASENLRADKAAISAAMSNAERASGIVSTAEGALTEISSKLVEMQGLVAKAANSGGLTEEEIAANQTQVDGIIDSINRIASQTSFQGMKLLDGSMGFVASAAGGTAKVTDTIVKSAKGVVDADLDVVVTIDTAAEQAVNATALAVMAGDDGTYEITGSKGSVVLTFAVGTTVGDMSNAINAVESITGLYVSTDHKVRSKDFGADQFVRVELVSGAPSAGITAESDDGVDAVVNIDGSLAAVDGYKASLKTGMLDIEFTMTNDLVDTATNTETITISKGGGATFQLSPNAGLPGQETIGIESVAAHRLGSFATGYVSDIASGKSYDLSTDASGAQEVVSAAIKQVANLRGRLGSFLNNTVDSTTNSLQVAYENVSAAESAIRDTDFATETASLTRSQILVGAATSVLSLANSAPQSVLGLLR